MMRIISTVRAVALASGLVLVAGAASAQECTCEVPRSEGSIGQIVAASGDVRIAEATNFTRASTDSALLTGARIIVGQGSANVRIGEDCDIALGSNSSLTLIPTEESICAAVETGQTAAYNDVGTALGVVGGAFLVVGGAILFSQDDDNPPPASLQ